MSDEPKEWLEEMMRDMLRYVTEDEQAAHMAPLAGALKDELLRRGWYWSQYAENYVSPRSGALR